MKGTAEQFKKDNIKKYHKGAILKLRDIARKTKLVFEFVEDRFYYTQSNLSEKVFFIDKLKKLDVDKSKLAYPNGWEVGEIEYRFGYYIISQYGRRKGHWTFAQFCPIFPLNDLKNILQKMKNKGIIGKNFKIL
ncbi:MAG: hypothetical protein WCT16_01825 [Candidatus Buchananbacteria bacterium]